MEDQKELQHNSAKIFRLAGQQIAQVLNEEEISLSNEERVKKLFDIFENVVTINEEKAQEFMDISDKKMQKSLTKLFDSIATFENQCLNHIARLSNRKK